MYDKQKMALKYGFGFVMIIFGLLLNYFDIGTKYFSGFSSLGSWMIYVGIFSMITVTIAQLFRKNKIVDERMLYIAGKANRITFLVVIIFSFIIIIIDGIKTIAVPYSEFMAYLVCLMLIVYTVSYRIMLKLN